MSDQDLVELQRQIDRLAKIVDGIRYTDRTAKVLPWSMYTRNNLKDIDATAFNVMLGTGSMDSGVIALSSGVMAIKVLSPSNSSNYWEVTLWGAVTSNIAIFDTKTFTADTWSLCTFTINTEVLDVADIYLTLSFEKFGSPGNISGGAPIIKFY